jgi:hypothetical protein
LRFLIGFTKKRSYYDLWIPGLVYRLTIFKKATILDLAKSFSDKVNPLQILPIIYHLISVGEFQVDLIEEINCYSTVCIGKNSYNFGNFFISEGER